MVPEFTTQFPPTSGQGQAIQGGKNKPTAVGSCRRSGGQKENSVIEQPRELSRPPLPIFTVLVFQDYGVYGTTAGRIAGHAVRF